VPQTITLGVKQLIEAAKQEIQELPPAEVEAMRQRPDVVIVDIRDIRELQRDGKIPGSVHCPRGMLEFWIDPDSPYFKPVFGEDKTFIFHCAADWRSALATQQAQRMGLKPVAHLQGGFNAWKAAGLAVEMPETKPAKS